MKKLKELFKAWRKGEEIEADVQLPLPTVLLILGVLVLLVWYLLK